MGNGKLLLCLVLLFPIKISLNKKWMNSSPFIKSSDKARSENIVGKVVPRRNINIHKAWTRTWHVYLQLFQTFVMIVVEKILYHIFPFRLCPIEKQNPESTTITSSLPPVKNTVISTPPLTTAITLIWLKTNMMYRCPVTLCYTLLRSFDTLCIKNHNNIFSHRIKSKFIVDQISDRNLL